MRIKAPLLLLFSTIILTGSVENYAENLKQAEEAYRAGDEGSPDAHFALAYKYSLTREKSIFHFSEAAKKGHSEALGYALESLLFRADSLKYANPQKALALYYQAKKANPELAFYDEANKLRIMKMCVEPGEFNAEDFYKKYDLQPHNDQTMYHVWQIAEEASRGGRFGDPDPELILHLVARGGWAPAELEHAVEEAYKNWKNGEVREFNICDHITSGDGMGFCAARADKVDEEDRDTSLGFIEKQLHENVRPLLNKAYDSMVNFVDRKSSEEEGHDGSGIAAWIISSRMDQKNAYLKLIEEVQGGFKPEPEKDFQAADRILNETYRTMSQEIEASPKDHSPFRIEELREVQRLWIPYRDDSANLFAAMNPATDAALWKSWLTENREKELRKLLTSHFG